MTSSEPTTNAVDAAAVQDAVTTINTSGAQLDEVARRIAEDIAVPAFAEIVKEYPALSQLDRARAVDYVSASLVDSLFDGVGADDDVMVELESGYVMVPGAYRDVLQASIVRYLNGNEKALATALAGGEG